MFQERGLYSLRRAGPKGIHHDQAAAAQHQGLARPSRHQMEAQSLHRQRTKPLVPESTTRWTPLALKNNVCER
jgi:hypothetical protein